MLERKMYHITKDIHPFLTALFRWAGAILLWCIVSNNASGQNCPANIDFEKGTLDGWRFFIGNVLDQGGVNVFNLTESNGPVDNRHAVMRSSPGDSDPFGGFPLASPDGSDY